MCKKTVLGIMSAFIFYSPAIAADVRWTGGGGDKLWSNPDNWNANRIPGAGDIVFIDVPAAKAPNGPILPAGFETKINGLICEVTGEPTLTINGGVLDITSYIWWGDGTDCFGTVYMTDGTVTTGSEFELGWGGGGGTWYMTGGTINAKELLIPTSSGASGTLYLYGGTCNVGSDGLSITEVGLIDIQAGILILEGDQVEYINGLVANKRITAYGGKGRIKIDFDITHPDRTTVTAKDIRRAFNPQPRDESMDVWRDTGMSWSPGSFTAPTGGHIIYFGENYDDVNEATVGIPQDANSFVPSSRLDFNQTYYWRVDEVNATPDKAVHKGEVWSFTTEPEVYALNNITVTASSAHNGTMAPEKTIDGSGLNAADEHGTTATDMWLTSATDLEPWILYEFDKAYKLHEMWVWNSNQMVETFIGFGLKGVSIEISVDGVNWTNVDSVSEFARAPGLPAYTHNTTVGFGGHVAKYVKIVVNSGWGGLQQRGLSEVRFYTIPTYALYPQPLDGVTTNNIELNLQWRPGREAHSHEVVLSRDRAAVADNSAILGTTENESYRTEPLNFVTPYFWRINEINNVGTPQRYEGDIWHFTTPEYLTIDDFDRYADEKFLEIWAFWADGYQDDGNGSLVGNNNEGERGIVYQGIQSMPIHYDNSAAPLSEVTRDFSPTLDWRKGDPTTLSLHVRGYPDDFQQAGDTMLVGAAGADIWDAADEFRYVYRNLQGNGSIVARVDELVKTDPWAKAGVMIRQSLTVDSSFAAVYLTAEHGVRYQARLIRSIDAVSDSSTLDGVQQTLTAPVWIKIERMGNEFNGYYATDEAGSQWTAMAWNPQIISMIDDTFIGLAVTSHNPPKTTQAEFSQVTLTGSVSGSWTPEAIGGDHPSNDPASVYLVVKDSQGQEQSLVHPNPNATTMGAWEPWTIALSDLEVFLGGIQSITVGVGDRNGSPNAAKGTLFVDLLQIGAPLLAGEDPNGT